MSLNDFDSKPAEEANNENMEESSEDAIPDRKSGVRVDPNAALQSARFFKNDLVHMSLIVNGARTKGIYTVYDRQYNARGGFVEYQLIDTLKGSRYKHGAWVRERDLRLERRG